MKNNYILIVLFIIALSLTACNKTDSNKIINENDNHNEKDSRYYSNNCGIYGDCTSTIEIPMGLVEEDVNNNIDFTIKIPLNYYVSGNGIDQDGEEKNNIFSGETLDSYNKNNKIENCIFDHLTIISPKSGEHMFDFRVYSVKEIVKDNTEENSVNDQNSNSENVSENYENSSFFSKDNNTSLTSSIRINKDTILIIWYGGSLIGDISQNEFETGINALIEIND